MTRYFTASIDAEDEPVSTVDRPYAALGEGARIVNLNIGPLSIMCSGKTEAQTEATLEKLHDALTTLLAASRARRVDELGISHPGAILTGGTIPRHVPGSYPRLSCCGGDVQLVDANETEPYRRLTGDEIAKRDGNG